MRFSSQSLRSKLLIVLLGSAVVPVTVATLLAVRSSQAAVERQVGDAQMASAQQLARLIDRIIYERVLNLRAAGGSGELAGAALGMGDSTQTTVVLAAVKSSARIARAVRMYSLAGALVGASSVTDKPDGESSPSSSSWFRGGLSPKSTYIGPVMKDASGHFVVRLADGVTSARGDRLGVIVMDLDWEALSAEALGQIEKGGRASGINSLRVVIADSTGTIVGSTVNGDLLTRSVDTDALKGKLQSRTSGATVSAFLSGDKALVGFAPLASNQTSDSRYAGFLGGGATVLVAESVTEAFTAATQLRNQLLVVSLLVAAIVGWFAVTYSRRIADPLIAAADVAEKLALGDTRVQLRGDAGADEAGRLNRALGGLLSYMQELRTAADKVAAGRSVAIHCRAGIGRSTVLAACTLILLGVDGAVALDMIAAARGIEVPETEAQRQWVLSFPRPVRA